MSLNKSSVLRKKKEDNGRNIEVSDFKTKVEKDFKQSVEFRLLRSTMTSGKIEGWRSDPGRWSHRFTKARRKEVKVEVLRRTKSVEDATEDVGKNDVNDAKVDNVDDGHDDGYVEADSEPDQTIDDSQVRF